MAREIIFECIYYPVMFLSFCFFLFVHEKIIPKYSSSLVPKYNQFTLQNKKEWDVRILSSVHAVIVSSICIYELLFDEELVKDPTRRDSVLVRANCAILIGYVIADAFIMLMTSKKNLETLMYYCHHVASAYAYYFVMSYGVFAYFANFRLMAEFSTPFVNQRWFLDALKVDRGGSAFIINGLLMTFTFITARVVTMPYYWYRVYQMCMSDDFHELGHMSYVLISTCFILDILNISWSAKMLRGAHKVLAAKFDRNSNIVESKDKSS